MQNLKIKNIFVYFAILLSISAPFTSFASDMWSETPDFNHESKIKSVITETVTYNKNLPLINMWAETPDLSEEKKFLVTLHVDKVLAAVGSEDLT